MGRWPSRAIRLHRRLSDRSRRKGGRDPAMVGACRRTQTSMAVVDCQQPPSFRISRRCRRRGRLTKRQHQAVGPVEEGRTIDHVDNGDVVQAGPAQLVDMAFGQAVWRLGQGGGGVDDGVPGRIDIRVDALVEQFLDIFAAPRRRGRAGRSQFSASAAPGDKHRRDRWPCPAAPHAQLRSPAPWTAFPGRTCRDSASSPCRRHAARRRSWRSRSGRGRKPRSGRPGRTAREYKGNCLSVLDNRPR